MTRPLSVKASRDRRVDQSAASTTHRDRGLAPPNLESDFLALQRAAGNKRVTELLRSSPSLPELFHAGLTTSRPRGEDEQEADEVAARVLRAPPSPRIREGKAQRPNEGDRKDASNEVRADLHLDKGQPLADEVREFFEPRFGADLGRVRVHTGPLAAGVAEKLGARAFTAGRDVVFGADQYAPQTLHGKALLAHELTHVAQQGAAAPAVDGVRPLPAGATPQVQRDIFEDVWEVGQAIGGAVSSAAEWLGERAREVGSLVSGAAEWAGERLRDAATWAINLIRDLPGRLARLAATLWEGLAGVVSFIPEAIAALASGGLSGFADWLWERAKGGGAWVLTLLSRVFDVLGGPEITEFIWHLVTKARPLTGEEIAAGSSVLGTDAIRWGDVRVSEGGLLSLVFALNEGRAFVMFHTINLPEGESIDTVVHELTHVYQYERAGSVYLGQALHAQATRGAGAYDYGGPAGLVAAKNGGKHYRDFNREEQAQIAQDYYRYVILGQGTLTADERQAYEFYIGELRGGDL